MIDAMVDAMVEEPRRREVKWLGFVTVYRRPIRLPASQQLTSTTPLLKP